MLFLDARHLYRQIDRAHRDWSEASIGFLANIVPLYREWFVHFRFPGHAGCRFVESPLGEILEGWEMKPLADISA
ncbi:MAG: hypothetical protein VKI42_06020 [Synechococcaceae cyanobacterium]|nr:hypothetical protein [Synechococcaceae cyanobacterium]